ncbi:MAG: SMC-Scp complex subunit ScpB [Candidatus Omnitrophota bacterium]
MTNEEIKRIVEALLFVSDKPLLPEDIGKALGNADTKIIRDAAMELKNEYEKEERSFRMTQLAGGFQILTQGAYAPWLKKFFQIRQGEHRLSSPAMETLAIIAYKQPITRAEIELIRGVNVDGVLDTLSERGLVRIAGRKDTVGRPIVYGTTKQFLQAMGLNSLSDLPKLKEFTEEDIKGEIENVERINEVAQDSGQSGQPDSPASQ